MEKVSLSFTVDQYKSEEDLAPSDRCLLERAEKAANGAYAPYSQFKVGAAALLSSGEIVVGSNQENASFPAGLCAERVLLSAVSSFYREAIIDTIAISAIGHQLPILEPIAPCGICRQALVEYENRVKHSIRLVLGGPKGKINVIESVSRLLPLAFTGKDLGIPEKDGLAD